MALAPTSSHVTDPAAGSVVDASVAANAAISLSKLADPTTGKVLGSVASAAAAVVPPGYEWGYDQITGNITVSSTTESSGTTVIACAAHTFDGAAVLAHFFSPTVIPGAGSDTIISLFEGVTQIGRIAYVAEGQAQAVNLTSVAQACNGFLRFTPTAGSHTYTVTANRTAANNGTIFAGSGGTGGYLAAFVRFTKA